MQLKSDYFYIRDIKLNKEDIFYKMLFEDIINNKKYWLSSRYVQNSTGTVGYGLRCVGGSGGGGIQGYNIYYSHNGSLSAAYGIRPIIVLDKDVQFDVQKGNKENPHQLMYDGKLI